MKIDEEPYQTKLNQHIIDEVNKLLPSVPRILFEHWIKNSGVELKIQQLVNYLNTSYLQLLQEARTKAATLEKELIRVNTFAVINEDENSSKKITW